MPDGNQASYYHIFMHTTSTPLKVLFIQKHVLRQHASSDNPAKIRGRGNQGSGMPGENCGVIEEEGKEEIWSKLPLLYLHVHITFTESWAPNR